MRARSACMIFLLLLAAPTFADFSGTLNFSTSNRSTATGIWAHTVYVCNNTAQCNPAGAGLSCFFDYDNVSDRYSGDTAIASGSYGWCNASGITNCYHNSTAYGTGTNICVTNITTRSCSSGAWQGVDNCSSGQTCTSAFGAPGNCTSSSSSTTSGGSSGTANTTSKASSIIFTSTPLDFDLVQGESAVRVVIVKNNGNATLYNITLSSSLAWATIAPAKWNQSVKNNETAFTVNFSAPEDAQVKAYSVALAISTHNSSVSASKTFYISVKPSNKTVEEQIFPDYERYLAILSELENTISGLKASGADVTEVESLTLNARSKLSQANQSLESKDYFAAQQFLDDAKGLLDAASTQAAAVSIPAIAAPADFTFMIIIAAIAGAVVFVIYMLLPPRKPKAASSFFEKAGGEKKKGFFRKKK